MNGESEQLTVSVVSRVRGSNIPIYVGHIQPDSAKMCTMYMCATIQLVENVIIGLLCFGPPVNNSLSF